MNDEINQKISSILGKCWHKLIVSSTDPYYPTFTIIEKYQYTCNECRENFGWHVVEPLVNPDYTKNFSELIDFMHNQGYVYFSAKRWESKFVVQFGKSPFEHTKMYCVGIDDDLGTAVCLAVLDFAEKGRE